MSEKPDPISIMEFRNNSTVTTKISSGSPQAEFFPWLVRDEESQKILSQKTLARFPVSGAIGLIGSTLTVLFSLLVLRLFEGHKVVDKEYHRFLPKPAAWLSIILNINAAMVQLAVSQGFAVSW
jgi:hypothetical protein